MYVGADNTTNGTSSNFLSNPYVLIGGSILIYWFLKRKSIINGNPLALRSVKSLEQKRKLENQTIAKENEVPIKLVEDVAKMSKVQVAQMIIDNQKMLNNTKMSNDERKSILKMVDYLEKELDNK